MDAIGEKVAASLHEHAPKWAGAVTEDLSWE